MLKTNRRSAIVPFLTLAALAAGMTAAQAQSSDSIILRTDDAVIRYSPSGSTLITDDAVIQSGTNNTLTTDDAVIRSGSNANTLTTDDAVIQTGNRNVLTTDDAVIQYTTGN